jgi:hypothetical protein
MKACHLCFPPSVVVVVIPFAVLHRSLLRFGSLPKHGTLNTNGSLTLDGTLESNGSLLHRRYSRFHRLTLIHRVLSSLPVRSHHCDTFLIYGSLCDHGSLFN